MMIEVIRSSPLASVQDQGRRSYRHMGVCLAGALDSISSQQANLAVGNARHAAVIEATFGSMQLRVHADTLVTLCGNDFNACIVPSNETTAMIPVYPGFAHVITAGSTLTLDRSSSAGCRAYIAFAGGIDVPLLMGSRSTDLNANFGGHEGQPLQVGSSLPLGKLSDAQVSLLKSLQGSEQLRTKRGVRSLDVSRTLRALDGAEAALIPTGVREQFWQQQWSIDSRSNRMGFRLKGKTKTLSPYPSLLSGGVMPGDVQLPSDGQPIILANDAQTTGGYARIAHVIEADRWQLAQLPPNSLIRFNRVSVEEALEATEQLNRYWQRLVLWQAL